MNYTKGFTLIEIIVVIAIIAVLSAVILFSVTQYINRGKNSNITGNLAVLIPAGEVYYNIGTTYAGFCDATASSGGVLKNAISQMPVNKDGGCYGESIGSLSNPAGVCCSVNSDGDAWAACTKEFGSSNAMCVDSRGVKREIDASYCTASITSCSE